jgi:hypothetical protein
VLALALELELLVKVDDAVAVELSLDPSSADKYRGSRITSSLRCIALLTFAAPFGEKSLAVFL